MERNKTKKTLLLKLIPVLGMIFLCVHFRNTFAANEEHGTIILYMTAVCLGLNIVLSFFQLKEKKWLQILYNVCIFLLIPLFIETAVEALNTNLLWEIAIKGNIFMNYMIYILLYVLVYACLGSMKISLIFSSTVFTAFGIANMYVKLYKGSPLLPWDFGSIKTAANVAGTFQFSITCEILFSLSVLLLVILLAINVHEKHKEKHIIVLRILCLVVFTAVSGTFYMTDIFAREFGATPDFFNQTRGYEQKGAVAEFVVNTKYMSLKQPSSYDPSTLAQEVEDYIDPDASILQEKPENLPAQPNIIVIMNESFSDLSVIGDFQTNIPYMPYIDSMKNMENVIEGNAYVSTIGTGTSNTEYEFLTGNPMAFLPIGSNAYQLYVDHTQPSLVSTVHAQDYSALSFHPYYQSSWNRVSVYENMGFEDFITIEDLASPVKLRRFVSDAYDFEYIKRLYEERDPDKPFFLFNITMQNHSSYEKEYANFKQEVWLEGLEGNYPETNQYLSLIKRTDDAFKVLIDYFANRQEPTIVLMFGDHQPFIENGFYSEVMQEKISEMEDEKAQLRYITRFVLWANYDIPEAWIDRISVNYLSVLLSEVANLKQTDYQKFLATLYNEVPVITTMGCIDTEGNYFFQDEENNNEEGMRIYRNAAYNNLREDEKRVNSLFYLQN